MKTQLLALLISLSMSQMVPQHIIFRNDANPIEKAKWLVGTWENATPRGTIYESWSIETPKKLKGFSFMIKENDTIIFENIEIIQEENTLYYIPTVKNQNDGKPVRFALKSIAKDKMVFENPSHDFPQVISYEKSGDENLVATISGTVNGQERKRQFPMKKIE